MIRVGSLYDRTLVEDNEADNKTGMTPKDQLNAIYHKVAELVPLKDAAYFNTMRALSAIGVEHVKMSSLKPEEENYLRAFFNSEIRPIISPQVVDKRHPFPFLKTRISMQSLIWSPKTPLSWALSPQTEASPE